MDALQRCELQILPSGAGIHVYSQKKNKGVIKKDGYVIYVFHSLPTDITGRLYSYLMERLLNNKFELRLLTPEERPFHKCDRSSIASFAGGLATVVVLRKCCNVNDENAPCLFGETGTSGNGYS